MLIHDTLRNIKTATAFGEVTFDENGFSDDLSATQQKNLGNVQGFTYRTKAEQKEIEEDSEDKAESSKKKEQKKEKAIKEKQDKEVESQAEEKPSNKKEDK